MSHWQPSTSLAWEEPLTFVGRFFGRDMAFLYSSLREHFSGTTSYLFIDPIDVKTGSNWQDLPAISDDGELPLWVGYLGYGMREDDARSQRNPIALPDFRLIRYAHLYRFDHENQRIDAYSQDGSSIALPALQTARTSTPISQLDSNLTRSEYESIVAETIEEIRDGNFYQANITRKFFGEFASAPDSWQLFTQLCTASPAPYSAYIRHEKTAILSSSPECFLTIIGDGTITTRPIKGSARRSADDAADQKICKELLASTKNHAENLMIVDLMRNDLSRVSIPQSVEVLEQSTLYSYRTIHHLISTIRAKKSPDIGAYDVVRACFPAGSMTGAPKIAAMRWCTAKEKLERGVYSGAIGWFGANDACDLSVVIRTLILDGIHFEFQVGGGIVADSTPEDEWRETMAKARGILAALGLKEEDLEKL